MILANDCIRLSRIAEINKKNFGEIVTAFNRIRSNLILNKDYMVDPTRKIPTFLITESGQKKIMQEVVSTGGRINSRLVIQKKKMQSSQFTEISDFCRKNLMNETYLRSFIRYHYVKFLDAGLIFEANVGELKKLFIHPEVISYKRKYILTKKRAKKTKGIYAIINNNQEEIKDGTVYAKSIIELNRKVDILTNMIREFSEQKGTIQYAKINNNLITVDQRASLIRYINVLSFVSKSSMKDIISGISSIVNKEKIEQYTEDDYKVIIDYLKREYRKVGLTLK